MKNIQHTTYNIQHTTYNSIDFLKVLASLSIILHHYHYIAIYSLKGYLVPNDFFTNYGALAVELFFILSGFLTEENIANKKRLSNFLLTKLKKWYPVVFITTTLCFVLHGISLYEKKTMLLGMSGYRLIDIFFNYLLIETGIFYSSIPINVPLWFLTPLLVCMILHYFISKVENEKQIILSTLCILLGGCFVLYGLQYPIANDRIGRGLYSYFAGVLLNIENKQFKITNSGRLIFVGGIIGSTCMINMGHSANLYLEIVPMFIMGLFLILQSGKIEAFFSMEFIKKCYMPFYHISFELFCTHFVVITLIALIDLCTTIIIPFDSYWFMLLYIVASYLLAFIIKKVSRFMPYMFLKEVM